MTSFDIERLKLTKREIATWAEADRRHTDWPVVYVLNNERQVYVGESRNAAERMEQHSNSPSKQGLTQVRVVLDDTFNKSACLDLESFLIRMFSGDGKMQVLNQNAGVTNASYFDRARYRETIEAVFEQLRTQEHLFTRTLPEIINSDLFKLSPFKALNRDQAIAIEEILEALFTDLETGTPSLSIVEGNPGTGKTVVAIYLLKLLEDIRLHNPEEPLDNDTIFSEFFATGHRELLQNLRVGIVVPQQSLRESIAKVFALTPGLSKDMVLTPFQVGATKQPFDLLIVDEAHRLNHRANQPSGPQNKRFAEINIALFGRDDPHLTQLDWLKKQSKHVILMLDTGQSVRPADLPDRLTQAVLNEAHMHHRVHPLRSQMRIEATQDYVGYVRRVLTGKQTEPEHFDGYDLRFFDNFADMKHAIDEREREEGLARLVAGYAWHWASKNDKSAFDIELDGVRMRWNSTQRDWINTAKSVNEIGSIHTVQGYDLNYAGVVIGKDLRFDTARNQVVFDRAEYHDAKGQENNRKLNIVYSDDDILAYVRNIYSVLLTRGIMGTYVYVCDRPLREHLRTFFGG